MKNDTYPEPRDMDRILSEMEADGDIRIEPSVPATEAGRALLTRLRAGFEVHDPLARDVLMRKRILAIERQATDLALAQYSPEQFCCFEVHEFEAICPRTGHTFRPEDEQAAAAEQERHRVYEWLLLEVYERDELNERVAARAAIGAPR